MSAQQLDKKQFNVVGTWNFLTNWQKLEQPLWATDMPAASGGNITGNIKSITELNLKGTELLRLLKQGVFDVAAALPIYVEDGAAVIEASDIAGVAKDFKMGRDIVTAWMPEMQNGDEGEARRHDPGHLPLPRAGLLLPRRHQEHRRSQGQEDPRAGHLAGRLRRRRRRAGVTIAFGEVVPALEKGVVDCGITGTMPGYKAKWTEVTNTLFRLPVGYTIGIWVVNQNVWNKLSKDTQAFIEKQMKAHEDKSWKVIEDETEEGVACNTGSGHLLGRARRASSSWSGRPRAISRRARRR